MKSAPELGECGCFGVGACGSAPGGGGAPGAVRAADQRDRFGNRLGGWRFQPGGGHRRASPVLIASRTVDEIRPRADTSRALAHSRIRSGCGCPCVSDPAAGLAAEPRVLALKTACARWADTTTTRRRADVAPGVRLSVRCETRSVRCPVVVGREAELVELADMCGQASTGHGVCVVITGEAGVGKSRLLAEAAEEARARGQVVLVGRSTPTDRVSPLRPVAEALLDGLRDRRPPDDPWLAPYLPAMGTLVPHWAAASANPPVPPAPVVLAEAVLRVLRWLSPERGAVLVLEDLHWVDIETLAVLEYLIDHVSAFPVALLLSARSDEPWTFGLEISTLQRATTLRLAVLADSEVAAMAAACLGVDDAPASTMERLRRDACGLPLLVEDLMDEAGRRSPLRYGEIIAGRLARLDPASRDVVWTQPPCSELTWTSICSRRSLACRRRRWLPR